MVFTFGKCYCDDSHKRSHFYSACLFLTSDKTFTELLNFTDGLSSIFSWFVAVRLSTTCLNECLSQSHVMITAFCVFTIHLSSFPTLVILLINLCPIIHP